MSDILYTSNVLKPRNGVGGDSIYLHLRDGTYVLNAASRSIDMNRAQMESLAEFILDVMENKTESLMRDCSTQMMDTVYRPDYTSAIYSKLSFQKTKGYDMVSVQFHLFGSGLIGAVSFDIHLDMEDAGWIASYIVQTKETALAA